MFDGFLDIWLLLINTPRVFCDWFKSYFIVRFSCIVVLANVLASWSERCTKWLRFASILSVPWVVICRDQKWSRRVYSSSLLCFGRLSGQWIIYLRWSRSFGWNCLFGLRCGPQWGHLFVWSQTVEVTCSRLLAESCCHVQLSMCWVITVPTIEAHGPVLPGQKGLPGKAWVSIRDQWRDHPVGWLTGVVPYIHS